MQDFRTVYAERLGTERASWKSVDLDLVVKLDLKGKPPAAGELAREIGTRYIETRNGQRFFERRMINASGEPFHHQRAYGNGEKFAVEDLEPETADQVLLNIVDSFMREGQIRPTHRPAPLRYLYVGKVPLEEKLPDSTDLGPTEWLGRDARRFLIRDVDWSPVAQDFVYTLDSRTGLPLRLESFPSPHVEGARPLWEWRADMIKTVEGKEFSMASRLVSYQNTASGPTTDVWSTHHETVRAVHFNREYPETTFWPQFQDGTRVWDAVSGGDYVVGGESKPGDASGRATLNANAGMVSPGTAIPEEAREAMIQVTPPPPSNPVWSWGFVGLGGVLLIVGLTILWRRA